MRSESDLSGSEREDRAFDAFCEAWFAGDQPEIDAFCQSHASCGPGLRGRIESFIIAVEGDLQPQEEDTAQPEESGDLMTGRVIDDYRIIKEIGRGGMARVYEAEQISLKRRVALKILSPHLSISRRAIQKFQREARAGGRQRHPGIVATFALGESEGLHYIAQELVESKRTLADMLDELRSEADLPRGYFRRAARLIASVAEAVAYAHSSGVIHRDLKPSNILLARDDAPKVSDFGLARVEGSLDISKSGDLMGTPYYMSPEQALGSRSQVDQRSDIFSMGVTLYETITLVRPFDGDTSHEVIKKILISSPRDPRQINSRVPRDLAVICLKAMEKDERLRYQTMEDFAEDLKRHLDGEPILARPAGRIRCTVSWIRRHRIAAAAVTGITLSLLAVAILMMILSLEKQRKHDIAARTFLPIHNVFGYNMVALLLHVCNDWKEFPELKGADFHFLAGIHGLLSDDYESAIESLGTAIQFVRDQGRQEMIDSGYYLLAVARFSLARTFPENHERALALERESFKAWSLAGECDPVSRESLVLYPQSPGSFDREALTQLQKPLRLNKDHYLCELALGMRAYHKVWQGGERGLFNQTISQYRKVLDVQPDNVMMLICLGRITFFVARFYNSMELIEEAEYFLEKARQLSGDNPNYMLETTLGQMDILAGNDEEAEIHFRKATEQAGDCLHIHNAYRGLAEIYARAGRHEEADEQFRESRDRVPFDLHTLVALGEFNFLFRKDIEKARFYAEEACKSHTGKHYSRKAAESHLAAASLLSARIKLAQGKFDEMLISLDTLNESPWISPRDLGLGCFVVALIPEQGFKSDEDRNSVIKLAENMCKTANSNAGTGSKISASICRSAAGVCSFLEGEHSQALSDLTEAMNSRESWPPEIRENYWFDDARDLYMMALCHKALAREPGGEKHEALARDRFREAESLGDGREPPFVYSDIFDGVRALAAAALGEE